jgi:hypothetical protein
VTGTYSTVHYYWEPHENPHTNYLHMTFATASLKHFNTNFKAIRATSAFNIAMTPSEKFTPRF